MLEGLGHLVTGIVDHRTTSPCDARLRRGGSSGACAPRRPRARHRSQRAHRRVRCARVMTALAGGAQVRIDIVDTDQVR